jgi:pyridoxal phosphate enzyme (YggS family)
MSIAENILSVKERIKSVCNKVGRNLDEITLVAVTKTIPPEKIIEVIDCGIKNIGENKIQETENKIKDEKIKIIGKDIKWHLIGHLQTNKVKKAIEIFDLIHSVDSLRLALEINKKAGNIDKKVEILIEVNTSYEDTKFGIEPKDTVKLVEEISKLENIKIKGLMTIGSLTEDKEKIRNCFKTLRKIRDEIREMRIENVDMEHLSMGMTNDFEIAIEESATILRIGTAIFGKRS